MTFGDQERALDLNVGKTAANGAHETRVRLAVIAGFIAYLLVLAAAGWGLPKILSDRAAVHLFGRAMAVNDLVRLARDKGLTLSLFVPVVFLVELLWVGWANSSVRQLVIRCTPSSMSDLTCFMMGQTPLFKALTVLTSLGVVLISAHGLNGLLRRWTGLDLSLAWAPRGVQFLIYFLVYSFFDYWSHRLDHHRWFWPLHRFHHAADDFCIVSAERAHPASFTRIIQQTLPAALVGASSEVIVEVNLFVMIVHLVIHSRIDSDFGWVGRYLLQSPMHHRTHHHLHPSLETGSTGSHYGLVPIWDHLFGTWSGDTDQSHPIGVHTPYRHGPWLIADMWRDYRDFWAGLSPFTARAPAVTGEADEKDETVQQVAPVVTAGQLTFEQN